MSTIRYSDPRMVPDKTVSMMNQEDRKALGLMEPWERQHKAGVELEKELQRLCEQELSRRGIAYLHISFRAREKKGWPDLTFCLHGRFVAVELKTATGVLSKDQISVMANLERNGALTSVIRSFDDFCDVLEAL